MENINEANEDNNNLNTGDEDQVRDATEAGENVDQGSTFSSFTESTPPPPAFTQPVDAFFEDRLVRDPEAKFGGVLSGIAHRFDWDVTLTRLAFIFILLSSGGAATIVYFLAWLIIPRAKYWPPVVRSGSRSRSFSSRDAGVASLGLAVIVALGLGAGQAAAIVVPLALIAGGIWLLTQSPRDEVAMASAGDNSGFAPTNFARVADSSVGSPAPQQWATPEMPEPMPAAPRTRKRKIGVAVLIVAILATPVLAVAAFVVPFASVVFGGSLELVDVVPITIEEIPAEFNGGDASYQLDLSNIDFSEIGEGVDPVEVDIDLESGRIDVIIANDVRVEAEANVGNSGTALIFEAEPDVTTIFEGESVNRSVTVDDPQLVLDLRIEDGDISVVRAE